MVERKGLIVSSISGFYNVKAEENIFSCRARGIFRKKYQKPVVGDFVTIKQSGHLHTITDILPRRNFFLRPPIANIDLIFLVVSVCEPSVNYLILDKLIAIAQYKKIDVAIVVTKTDLLQSYEIADIYNLAGIRNVFISNVDDDLDKIYNLISGKISAFCGNSGVGKSTLLNRLFPGLNLQTNSISNKLGRGKHTTRVVELFPINGGFVADTPGFSTVDILKYDKISKEELSSCFREFWRYSDCKFRTCSHTFENNCGVKEAVDRGFISRKRYENYCAIYNELKDKKYW